MLGRSSSNRWRVALIASDGPHASYARICTFVPGQRMGVRRMKLAPQRARLGPVGERVDEKDAAALDCRERPPERRGLRQNVSPTCPCTVMAVCAPLPGTVKFCCPVTMSALMSAPTYRMPSVMRPVTPGSR